MSDKFQGIPSANVLNIRHPEGQPPPSGAQIHDARKTMSLLKYQNETGNNLPITSLKKRIDGTLYIAQSINGIDQVDVIRPVEDPKVKLYRERSLASIEQKRRHVDAVYGKENAPLKVEVLWVIWNAGYPNVADQTIYDTEPDRILNEGLAFIVDSILDASISLVDGGVMANRVEISILYPRPVGYKVYDGPIDEGENATIGWLRGSVGGSPIYNSTTAPPSGDFLFNIFTFEQVPNYMAGGIPSEMVSDGIDIADVQLIDIARWYRGDTDPAQQSPVGTSAFLEPDSFYPSVIRQFLGYDPDDPIDGLDEDYVRGFPPSLRYLIVDGQAGYDPKGVFALGFEDKFSSDGELVRALEDYPTRTYWYPSSFIVSGAEEGYYPRSTTYTDLPERLPKWQDGEPSAKVYDINYDAIKRVEFYSEINSDVVLPQLEQIGKDLAADIRKDMLLLYNPLIGIGNQLLTPALESFDYEVNEQHIKEEIK